MERVREILGDTYKFENAVGLSRHPDVDDAAKNPNVIYYKQMYETSAKKECYECLFKSVKEEEPIRWRCIDFNDDFYIAYFLDLLGIDVIDRGT